MNSVNFVLIVLAITWIFFGAMVLGLQGQIIDLRNENDVLAKSMDRFFRIAVGNNLVDPDEFAQEALSSYINNMRGGQ